MSVCDTTWNCISLCNCSHEFCKNIPVSFDFITTWNQGVFLCSPCITLIEYIHIPLIKYKSEEKYSYEYQLKWCQHPKWCRQYKTERKETREEELKKNGHLHIYWKGNMEHYQTVRENYFYEQPFLYCRNLSLQKYQLQRQIQRRWDLSTHLCKLWEKVCGPDWKILLQMT